jgi:hypothetical protein
MDHFKRFWRGLCRWHDPLATKAEDHLANTPATKLPPRDAILWAWLVTEYAKLEPRMRR